MYTIEDYYYDLQEFLRYYDELIASEETSSANYNEHPAILCKQVGIDCSSR